jgi:hypothetical protein
MNINLLRPHGNSATHCDMCGAPNSVTHHTEGHVCGNLVGKIPRHNYIRDALGQAIRSGRTFAKEPHVTTVPNGENADGRIGAESLSPDCDETDPMIDIKIRNTHNASTVAPMQQALQLTKANYVPGGIALPRQSKL